jgi:type III secretion protein V
MRIKISRVGFPPPGFAGFLAARADLGVAVVLLAVLALLVLPAPNFLLDLAIALNFCFAMLLLASSLYIRSALDLATFPSLLLLTTLFRLGLAVATTKMILLHAHAGAIIQTFGRLVVGGNVVVGLVIFCVLCAVQFIVVAKGSDRVAEVAARFTLDSIPGKQMSIDADLRAGAITNEQAKDRRDVLQREIQLHGAMDGAMKFVKGDAIVGILIALVNIIGGIVIGTVDRGMSMGQATQTYVVLTVGDGLVSQIPSLIVSIAAGLIITRGDGGATTAEGDESNLGRSMFDQLGRRPKPVFMAAVAAFLLACIPGFPHLQFALIGLFLVALGYASRRHDVVVAGSDAAPMRNMTRDGATYVSGMLDMVEMGTCAPLCVRVSEGAYRAIDPLRFDEALGRMRDQLTQGLGLPFPGLSMRGEQDFEPDGYRIEVNGDPVADGRLFAGHVFAVAYADVAVEPVHVDGVGEGAWLEEEQATSIHNRLLLAPCDVLAGHLQHVCATKASAFVGTQETKYLLDRLAILFPDLVESLNALTTPSNLARVLRDLLQERVSIRNLRAIGEAIVSLGPEGRSHERALRTARIALRRQIVAGVMDTRTGRLPVLTLEPSCDKLLVGAIDIDGTGQSRLALDSVQLARVEQTLRIAYTHWGTGVVLVCGPLLRWHLAGLVRGIRWPVSVLSVEELAPEVAQPERLGSIELAPEVA